MNIMDDRSIQHLPSLPSNVRYDNPAFGLCWVLPVSHGYLLGVRRSTTAPTSVWAAFIVVIWVIGLFFRRLSETLVVWAHRQWERGVAEFELPFSDGSDEAVDLSPRVSEASYDCEAQWSSPPLSASASSGPSVHAIPVASPSSTSLDWHVLNFCRLDAPGYRRAAQQNRWRYLSFSHRLRAETVHFEFLLQEDLSDFQPSMRSPARSVPGYVSLRDCPPDYTIAPAYYDL
ncbi:hypothetical protein KC19_VG196400 [Ceratodon purpureus]|uniref:Uncharacterized protein n=1 Tax=Ceratodon purpureus TaxID=3225 RepID=A0A8T0HRT8_CERPU|nr:hypothetical protein KC19_VG196400 [Ceratodon purpureus]